VVATGETPYTLHLKYIFNSMPALSQLNLCSSLHSGIVLQKSWVRTPAPPDLPLPFKDAFTHASLHVASPCWNAIWDGWVEGPKKLVRMQAQKTCTSYGTGLFKASVD
jgi:hypothetical protein